MDWHLSRHVNSCPRVPRATWRSYAVRGHSRTLARNSPQHPLRSPFNTTRHCIDAFCIFT
eukprot:6736787-Lingulodinium_polyedra.AAC.1